MKAVAMLSEEYWYALLPCREFEVIVGEDNGVRW
jgi:hypothetical protein